MQIIQSIKDRGGVVMAIFIAIALISFILMDSKSDSNRGSLTGNNPVGSINGSSIDIQEFDKRFKQEEAKQSQQRGGQPLSGADAMGVRDQVWNQIVAENVFYAEADKLGINLTSKELSYILQSNDPSNPFLQEKSLMGADGKIDPAKVSEALVNIKKFKGEQRDNIDAQIIEPLKLSTAASKYGAMMNGAAYYPTWMKEKELGEDKSFATITYATVPYNEISDSTVAVSDADVNSYVAKHKELFKQEAGRTISYLSFSQDPSTLDSANARKSVEELKASFALDTSAKNFVARSASVVDFQDEFLPLSRIQSAAKDSIIKQAVGVVSGPYVDGANYSIAKIIGTKELPDSVKARHILIGTRDPQSGAELMSDSAAKKLADSLFASIKAGANFVELAAKYSTDGSKTKGGDLGTFGYGQMVPEFNEFCFTKAVGAKDVVKTQFGYHIIEVMSQSNFKPAYKIAFVAKPIVPSDETINAANLAATKAAANKGGKELADYASKNGLKMVEMPTIIKENEFRVGNLQDARSIVKWAFGAKKGAVSDPIPVGNQFVVATVVNVYAEGTQDATIARSGAESIIRKEKKAALIIEKLGPNPTMETITAKYNKQTQVIGADSTLTYTTKIINGLGVEPKIVGAAFNATYLTKPSAPIEGNTGVYIIKVNTVQPKTEKTVEQQTSFVTTRNQALKQGASNWFEALRKQATIKDKRSKYF